METRNSVAQRLTSTLKLYFPAALDLAGPLHGPLHGPLALELLGRWPWLRELQRANRKTLQKFFDSAGDATTSKSKSRSSRFARFDLLGKSLQVDPHHLPDVENPHLDDENRFQQQLQRRNSPRAKLIPSP